MNCTDCFQLPDHLRRCNAGIWPSCDGYTCTSGQPKHQDEIDMKQGEKIQAEYIARLTRMGYKF